MTSAPSRKRIFSASAAALLAGTLSVGGALITAKSTIFDNVFETEFVPPDAGELLVEGPKMSASFTGAVDGELVSEYFTLTNAATTHDIRFNLTSRQQPGGVNAGDLAAALSTRIAHGGAVYSTGTLKDMRISASDQITIPAGESILLRLDVYVADHSSFLAAGLGDDAKVTVDFLFDSIFLP